MSSVSESNPVMSVCVGDSKPVCVAQLESESPLGELGVPDQYPAVSDHAPSPYTQAPTVSQNPRQSELSARSCLSIYVWQLRATSFYFYGRDSPHHHGLILRSRQRANRRGGHPCGWEGWSAHRGPGGEGRFLAPLPLASCPFPSWQCFCHDRYSLYSARL